MSTYRHQDLNDRYIAEYNIPATTRINEFFGADIPILILDSNCTIESWEYQGEGFSRLPENLVTIHCESRPLDRTARIRSRTVTSPVIGDDAMSGEFYLNTAPEACSSGWYPVNVTLSSGVEEQVGVFNPEARSWHTCNPWETLAYLVSPYDCDMDILFGDFAAALREPEWMSVREAERLQARMDSFQEFIERAHHASLETIEGNIAGHVQELIDARTQVEWVEQRLIEKRAELDALIAALDQPVDVQAQRELDAIERHAKVHGYMIDNNNNLVVQTTNLYLPHPDGDDVDAVLGEYDITLDFRVNKALPKNITNRKGTYDHPHVHDGSFCSGTWGPTIQDLLKERQIAAAVNFVIDTLEHCNPDDDWGRSYRHWFTMENNDEALARSTRG